MSKQLFGLVSLLVGMLLGFVLGLPTTTAGESLPAAIPAQPVKLVETIHPIFEQCVTPLAAPVTTQDKPVFVRPQRHIEWLGSSTVTVQNLFTAVTGSTAAPTVSSSSSNTVETGKHNCGVAHLDGDTPGCEDGRNDGPGTAPGSPGARGGNGNH